MSGDAIQFRSIVTADSRFSVTPRTDDKPATLTGYALVWETPSTDRGGHFVVLPRGSATFAAPTLALFNHNPDAVLGNTANGTLRIVADDIGAKVEIDLPDTTAGRDALELVSKRYVQGMSFAMTRQPRGKTQTVAGRKLLYADPFIVDEVTITATPAFATTSIGLKGSAGFSNRIGQELELERLKFAGLTLSPTPRRIRF